MQILIRRLVLIRFVGGGIQRIAQQFADFLICKHQPLKLLQRIYRRPMRLTWQPATNQQIQAPELIRDMIQSPSGPARELVYVRGEGLPQKGDGCVRGHEATLVRVV